MTQERVCRDLGETWTSFCSSVRGQISLASTQNWRLTSKICVLCLTNPNILLFTRLDRHSAPSQRLVFCSRNRIVTIPSLWEREWSATITFRLCMRDGVHISIVLVSIFSNSHTFVPIWYGTELTRRTAAVVTSTQWLAISIWSKHPSRLCQNWESLISISGKL